MLPTVVTWAVLSTVVFSSAWIAHAAEKVFDFKDEDVNRAPRGFQSALAGTGGKGDWRIVLDDVPSLMPSIAPLPSARPAGKRPVLAQLARERTDEHFPLLVCEEETFGDFTLTTRFKLVDGAEEQMAGIAFRLQDERNFYYVRASGLGGTFHFFKVVDGVRLPPRGTNLPIAKGVWHDLTLECKGTRIRALMDGKEAIPLLEDRTFSSGKIAFLTKSDAVSYFADTIIHYKPRETLAQILVRDAYRKYPRLLALRIYAPTAQTGPMQVVASLDPGEVGRQAPSEAGDVLAKQGYYYGKDSGTVMLTLPLRDNSGDKVAAVRVVMKSFPGQTEKNAVARAMPVVQSMETRIQTWQDLIQ
jgi:hypothetical protein